MDTGVAVRSDSERYRLLVEAIADCAIYMLDPDGRVASWNPGAERFKGYRADEIIGQHFSRFYTDEDRAKGEPAKALATAAAEGRFEKEAWRVRKDGARFWAHVVIDPIRGPRGEIIGFAKITRDITEQHETQLALEETRHALFQSQKLDAIGQLTGGVAHDFNNLLMAVMGSLELLRKRLPADDPKARALLENAVEGARRGAALTQRMLAFARKQDLQIEGVDIAALICGMSGLLTRSIGPRITLATHFAPGLPPALTDANQLEMALLNLVVNARDAMPDGGEISLEATSQRLAEGAIPGLAAGAYVRLTLIDDGEGMSPAVLERATEPFFTTKGVGKGTGLGLSMVYGLAEQSGGRLQLGREPGHGARIDLWLPQAGSVAPAKSTAVVAPGPSPVGPLTVLVVDDDPLVLINTAAILEDLGHRVIHAASGAQALAALDSQAADLVLTDYAMPRMNGLQLAEQLARRRPSLNVVLASGYAELPEGSAAGVRRIAKPYSQADLDRLLRDIFGGAGREPLSDPAPETPLALDEAEILRLTSLAAGPFVPLAETLPVMLWIGDENGRCVYLNKAQRDFWGVPGADVSTFSWNSTLLPEDAEGLFEVFRGAMAHHEAFTTTARYRRFDGAIRTLQTEARPRFGAGEKFLGMVGVNTDITD